MVAKDENPAESSSDDKQAEKQPDTEQEKELNELDKEEGEEYDKNEQVCGSILFVSIFCGGCVNTVLYQLDNF